MSKKPETKEEETKETKKGSGSADCAIRSPGPKYQLKTLVGYEEHCISKFRNPAYTFGRRQTSKQVCEVPGPKYLLTHSRHDGFTFGYAVKSFDNSCGPGPKYRLPDVISGPFFTIKSRTNYRKGSQTPGPYSVLSRWDGPAYTISLRAKGVMCGGGPGPQTPCSMDVVKPKSPSYSMAYRQTGKIVCDSPGPKYHPKFPRPHPMYSFGIKHSPCAPPYIVECDEKC